jgi:hypothetical protein
VFVVRVEYYVQNSDYAMVQDKDDACPQYRGAIPVVSLLPAVFSHPFASSFHSFVHPTQKHLIPPVELQHPDQLLVAAEIPNKLAILNV